MNFWRKTRNRAVIDRPKFQSKSDKSLNLFASFLQSIDAIPFTAIPADQQLSIIFKQ